MFDPSKTKDKVEYLAEEVTRSPEVSMIKAIKPTRLSKGYSLGAGDDLLQSTEGNPPQTQVHSVPINAATRVMTRIALAQAGRSRSALAGSWTSQIFRSSCPFSPARTREVG